jgi:hypothetical protein
MSAYRAPPALPRIPSLAGWRRRLKALFRGVYWALRERRKRRELQASFDARQRAREPLPNPAKLPGGTGVVPTRRPPKWIES